MQHFFLSIPITDKNFLVTDPRLLHQMNRVLRMRTAEHFIALDGSGFEYECEVRFIREKEIEAEILHKKKNEAEPVRKVILFQALPKKMELFEFVLQKGTEIGVSEFVPLITERTERHEPSKPERLSKILVEAAEQSERGKVPKLQPVKNFEEAICALGKNENAFLFHGRGNYPLFSSLIDRSQADQMYLFIGPEGGFTKQEVEHAQKNGVKIATLGKRVLRTETAGIVAAALALQGS